MQGFHITCCSHFRAH